MSEKRLLRMKEDIFEAAIMERQMSDNIGGEGEDTKKKCRPDDDNAEEKRHGSIIITNNNHNVHPRSTQHERKEPHWVEKGTLIVLFLTFFAALFAGYEARRLADLTDTAVTDTQRISTQQAKDTAQSLQFAKDAAEAAKTSARAAEQSANTSINVERPFLHIFKADLVHTGPRDTMPTVLMSPNSLWGSVANSNSVGAPKCVLPAALTEIDLDDLVAKRKVVIFYGFIKYEGMLNFTYTRGFGVFYVWDKNFFADINSDAYNYDHADERQSGQAIIRPAQ
jgi:hypothetical protein